MRFKRLGVYLLVLIFIFMSCSTVATAAGGKGGSKGSQHTSNDKGNNEKSDNAMGMGKHGNQSEDKETPTSDETGEDEHSGEDKEGTGGSGNKGGSENAKKGGQSGSGSNEKGGQGGASTEHGTVTLKVTVTGINQEVYVTLTREDDDITKKTVNGIATFISEASGDCTIKGEDISGYLTPVLTQVSLTGKNKYFEEELKYIPADIVVSGVKLSKNSEDIETLKMVKGYDATLTATVIPANASNNNLVWESSDATVATVVNGVISAHSEGTTNIKVTSEENETISDVCVVTVVSIEELVSPDDIYAIKDQLVILPEKVTAKLSDDTTQELDVTWKDGAIILEDVFIVPTIHNPESYTLTGIVQGTDLTVALTIMIDNAQHAISVNSVSLNVTQNTVTVGESFALTPIINPITATVKDVTWTSSDESIAEVDADGVVTASAPGIALIEVNTVDGNKKAYCVVSVVPPAEIVMIFPTDEADKLTAVSEFPEGTRENVYINVQNLVTNLQGSATYYVKVEQRGSGSAKILGHIGMIDLTATTITFNLYSITEFDYVDSFSNEYFLSMSSDASFPSGDELDGATVTTNFKIGSATPTIPQANVRVTNELIGGNRNPAGIIFILARELDEDASDLTWQDYYNFNDNPCNPNDPYNNDNPVKPIVDYYHFCDEVKMIGTTNEDGVVVWETPRETLKLGGYVLLEVTPKGYMDNLNLVNPSSEDYSLLKEVHLTRNSSVEVSVITNFIR